MASAGRHEVDRRRSRAGIVLWTVFALLAAMAVPAAIAATRTVVADAQATGAIGEASASEWISTDGTDLPITQVPSNENPEDRPPFASGTDKVVAAVVTDIETYWTATLPAIGEPALEPLRGGLTAIDSAAPTGSAPCVGQPSQITGNAYYCPTSDGIVFDSAVLVPVLLAHYGIPGLVATFAHEFGHAVQARIGPTREQQDSDPTHYPALLVEQQGDCYAGAFLAWVDGGSAPHIHFDGDSLLQAVNAIVDFADPVTLDPSDRTAHGLAVDRLSALATGFTDGASACHSMTLSSARPVLGTVPLPAGGVTVLATNRYPDTAAVLTAARESIGAFTGDAVTDGTTPDAAALASATPYGQFAQASVLAYEVGRSRAAGIASGPSHFAACFVGAWTASVWGRVAAGTLGSWPGDADEALAALRHRPEVTFPDLLGFVSGFRGGLVACG